MTRSRTIALLVLSLTTSILAVGATVHACRVSRERDRGSQTGDDLPAERYFCEDLAFDLRHLRPEPAGRPTGLAQATAPTVGAIEHTWSSAIELCGGSAPSCSLSSAILAGHSDAVEDCVRQYVAAADSIARDVAR